MTFRLVTLLYLFALLAAALAVFGTWGVLVALFVLGSSEAWHNARTSQLAAISLWMLIVVMPAALLLYPAVVEVRTPSRSAWSKNNAKYLLLAMLNYEATNGHLPPRYVADDEGRPLYSWRVLLLPHLDCDAIYKKLHLDKPWDGPHNRPLLDNVDSTLFESPRVSRPARNDGTTDYVAVVGDRTVWPENQTIRLSDVRDGCSHTIALLEVGGLNIHWAEPRDVSYDDAIDLLTRKGKSRESIVRESYFGSETYVFSARVVGFLDGHTGFLGPLRHPEDAMALLTRAGGGQLKDQYKELPLPPSQVVATTVYWDRFWGVLGFVILALLPIISKTRRWVFPSRESAIHTH